MSETYDHYEDVLDQRDKYNDLINFLARLETHIFNKMSDIGGAEKLRDMIKDKLNEHDIYEW